MRSTAFGPKRPTHPGIITILASFVLIIAILASILIGILVVQAQSQTIVEWTFDAAPDGTATGTLSPSHGAGVLSTTNVVTTSFKSGQSNGSNDSGFETTGYPAQSTSNKTAGLQIQAGTVGFQDIVFTFYSRHSSFSANKVVVQYSTDGTNYTDFQTLTISSTLGTPANQYLLNTIDFSAIPSLDNNPNAKFRILAVFGNETQYIAALAWTSAAYNSGAANIRFDNVKVSGTPFASGTATATPTLTSPATNTPTETATGTRTPTPTSAATSSPGGACTNYTATDLPKFIDDAEFITTTGHIDPYVITSTLNVPDDIILSDVDLTGFRITHEYMQDLKAELISPLGTEVTLFTQVGSNGTEFNSTTFDENVLTPIEQGSAPFAGSYDPEGNLAVFNLQHSVGTWKLRISDVQEIHIGNLNGWTLKICTLATPTPTNTPTITPTPTETPGNAETATAQAVIATSVAGTATAVWLSTPGNPETATATAATATSVAATATSAAVETAVAATATTVAAETSVAATATSAVIETAVAATATTVAAETAVAATATSAVIETMVAATATSVAAETSLAATATSAVVETAVAATATAVAAETTTAATETAVALSTPSNAATATSVSATATAAALSTPGNAATATSVSATATAAALSTPGNAATATSVAAAENATATSVAATATAVVMTPTPSGPVTYRILLPIVRK